MSSDLKITSDEEQAVFDSLLASALTGVASTLWDKNRSNGQPKVMWHTLPFPLLKKLLKSGSNVAVETNSFASGDGG